MEAFSHRGGLAFRLTELGRTTELPEESSWPNATRLEPRVDWDVARVVLSSLRRDGCARNVMPSKKKPRDPPSECASIPGIASTPGMTSIALSAALNTSHHSMPNIMLAADEQADITAYIMSLKWPLGAPLSLVADENRNFRVRKHLGRHATLLTAVCASGRHAARVLVPEASDETHLVFRESKRWPAPSVSQYRW
jgi:hypothetical protein